ncbi:hypothetical protein BGX27_007148 [Mortierella sp. AM989]|nr:hypothetical protein BGX27_007148 [Mortierella sp. AM989]
MSTHPLEIPEILFLLSKYLPRQDQLNCLKVSKSFHSIFISEIWRTIRVEKRDRDIWDWSPNLSNGRIYPVDYRRPYSSTNITRNITRSSYLTGSTYLTGNPYLTGNIYPIISTYPTGSALQRNKHHIQEIVFFNDYPQEYFLLRDCLRLRAVTIHHPTSLNRGYTQASQRLWERYIFMSFAILVSAHTSTIQNVTLDFYMDALASPPMEIWDALNQCPKLDQLYLSTLRVSPNHTPSFFQACSKAQSLTLKFVAILDFPRESDENPINYINCDRLQEVKIIRAVEYIPFECDTPYSQARMLRRFHNLRSLDYRFEGDKQYSPTPSVCATNFFRTIIQGSWILHQLENLNFASAQIGDALLAEVLGKMHRIRSLNVSDTSFGHLSLQALLNDAPVNSGLSSATGNLQRWKLCGFIETLNIRHCKNISGAMIQTILESCPQLTQLLAERISIDEIARGKAWVCKNMRTMKLYLSAELNPGPDIAEKQHIAYTQLAKLTKLRELNLTEGDSLKNCERRTLDLRVKEGLSLLAGLNELCVFSFLYDPYQQMEIAEAHWMIANWPSLNYFLGVVNQEPCTREAFAAILCSKNITASNSFSPLRQ